MAACWKVSWNVDPLAFSVPERLELLPPPLLLLLLLPDELQAAENKAKPMTARPAVVTRCLRRRCISGTPIPRRYKWPDPGARQQPARIRVSVTSLACRQYRHVKEQGLNGKKYMDRR